MPHLTTSNISNITCHLVTVCGGTGITQNHLWEGEPLLHSPQGLLTNSGEPGGDGEHPQPLSDGRNGHCCAMAGILHRSSQSPAWMGEQHCGSCRGCRNLQEPCTSDYHGSGAGNWPPQLLPQQLKAPVVQSKQSARLAEQIRRSLTARTRLRRSSNFSSASRSFCTSSKRLISSAANFSGSTWISFGIR